MKRVKIEKHIKDMDKDFNTWYTQHGTKDAILEFPSGELMNSEIAGYIWAWKMTGKLEYPLPIDENDRFNAQGLEGKVRVKTNLTTAIIVHKTLPSYRCQILEA